MIAFPEELHSVFVFVTGVIRSAGLAGCVAGIVTVVFIASY